MTKGIRILMITLIVILVLAAVTLGALLMKTCTFIGGGLYPKGAEALDLRNRNLTIEDYEQIAQAMPGCYIRWNVPLDQGKLDSASRKITVASLSDADVQALMYVDGLQTVDGRNCRSIPQLARLQELRPDCEVLYYVTIDGAKYSSDTTDISVPKLNADQLTQLGYLTKLENVNATGCEDKELLNRARQEHPQWRLSYSVKVQGMEYAGDLQEASLLRPTYEELQDVLMGLGMLQKLEITGPQATAQELKSLQEANPNVEMLWSLNIGQNTYDCNAEEVDITGSEFKSVEEAKALADFFPKLQKLILGDCGLDNELLAEFREEMRPQYKVVWTLHLGKKCVARTDDTYFFPTQQKDFYFQDASTYNIRYLEDLVALDLGDQPNVKNVEWAVGTPKLKYLILAWANVKDIEPLRNLKELVFLELDHTIVKSLEPLTGCTALEDLNLGATYASYEPLKQMTWLKHLWWTGAKDLAVIELREALPNTEIKTPRSATVAEGWREIDNYFKMRDALNAPYMKW